MNALVVRPMGRPVPQVIAPGLEPLQELVGGYVERLGGADWVAWFNEDGKVMGLEPNPVATVLMERLMPGFSNHDFLVGTVVFLGVGDEGENRDVPDAVWKAAAGL